MTTIIRTTATRSKTFRYFRISLTILLGIMALIVVVFAVSYGAVNNRAEHFIKQDLQSLPHAEVVMILGAAVLSSGELSSVLKDRVDTAIDVYRNKVVDKILVTGDNGTLEHNEVDPVKKYLLRSGVPEQDIFLDHAGFDTYSSIYRARDVFVVNSMIIITQRFHLPRALFIARHLGIMAYGVPADRGHYRLSNNLRELFGDVKAVIDVLMHRQPRYLGEQIPITGKANTK